MKIVAALAICLDTLFMAFSGVHGGKKSHFAIDYPWLFNNASIIGLKIPDFEHGIKLSSDDLLVAR